MSAPAYSTAFRDTWDSWTVLERRALCEQAHIDPEAAQYHWAALEFDYLSPLTDTFYGRETRKSKQAVAK